MYFGLLALSSSDICKKRIEQAPIGYDSDSDHSNICLLHAGLPFGGLSHTQMHWCTYILTTRAPVRAKNKFAITSMSSSSWNLIQYMGSFTQVHKIVNKLKWTLRENLRQGPRCMKCLKVRGVLKILDFFNLMGHFDNVQLRYIIWHM